MSSHSHFPVFLYVGTGVPVFLVFQYMGTDVPVFVKNPLFPSAKYKYIYVLPWGGRSRLARTFLYIYQMAWHHISEGWNLGQM